MKITKRQLRRIIREQISDTPTGRVEVEGDFYQDDSMSDDTLNWNEMSYEEQEADAGLPPVIEIPPDVMAEYKADAAEYGEEQANDMITDWLSDEHGWLHQGWSWV